MEKIAVIGLGYVGLPLAVALAKNYKTLGFDIDSHRIKELRIHHDRTKEVEDQVLQESSLTFTDRADDLKGCDVYIVTVPTPVDDANKPDLRAMISASEMVGKVIQSKGIVVFESTVYPGVTEEICSPVIEKISGLESGTDFYLGYSPERINPGDRRHTIHKITKVIAGQNAEVTEKLAQIYGSINEGNVFKAKNIKTAEAAKVIENAQRDINIAFINEISMIFNKMGVSIYDVLEASSTKWNFLPFTPGLVGGHCIGVDPFYLAYCSKKLGHIPEVILAGRRINDHMGAFLAAAIHQQLIDTLGYGERKRLLVLGLTFKENVPDLRNTKVFDVIRHLQAYGYDVDVHDPLADVTEARELYGINLLHSLKTDLPYDCIVGAVQHDFYLEMETAALLKMLKPQGLIADIKNMWAKINLPKDIKLWRL